MDKLTDVERKLLEFITVYTPRHNNRQHNFTQSNTNAQQIRSSKKRSMHDVEVEDIDTVFQACVKEMDYTETTAIFKTFHDPQFYKRVAFCEDHPCHRQILSSIVEYKAIINKANKARLDGDAGELYGLLRDQLINHLVNYQQLIFLFELQTSSS